MKDRSNLTGNITNRHELCTAEGRKAAQQVFKTAQNIAGTHLQSVRDVSDVRCQRGAQSRDNTQPDHSLFTLTLSGFRHRGRADTETSATAPSKLQLLYSSGSQGVKFIVHTPPVKNFHFCDMIAYSVV